VTGFGIFLTPVLYYVIVRDAERGAPGAKQPLEPAAAGKDGVKGPALAAGGATAITAEPHQST
jgi:hypothetical protein